MVIRSWCCLFNLDPIKVSVMVCLKCKLHDKSMLMFHGFTFENWIPKYQGSDISMASKQFHLEKCG